MNKENWTACIVCIALLTGAPLHAAQQDAHDSHDETSHQAHPGKQGSIHENEKPDAHGDKHDDAHDDEHDDAHGSAKATSDEHEEEGAIELSDAQQRAAGIVVERIELKAIPQVIEAPGEVRLNTYASSRVSPRIEAQVVSRHARRGDLVGKGKPLATLSSVSVAAAQSELLVAAAEWRRVSKLGKKIVAERRFVETEVALQQARARLLAFGLTEAQVDGLASSSDVGKAVGRFTLLSPQEGRVIKDDFVLGQMVAPGDLLFEITDDSTLWVEARVNPKSVRNFTTGANARVRAGDVWLDAKVVQIDPVIDETTRTVSVRLELPRPETGVRSGQFVTVTILTGDSGEQALALPLDSVLRSADGDWQVFVEEAPGKFEGREVTLVRQHAGLAIIEGVEPGVRVVTRGAFFVQSELAKSGFAVHNH